MRLIFLLLLTPALLSCEESDKNTSCDFEDPIEEISWLNQIKEGLEMRTIAAGYEIIQYFYEENIAFYVDDCFGCSGDHIKIYDCEGNVICELDGIQTCSNFFDSASDSTMLLDGVNRN